jgi:hypothetical protein
MKVYPDFRPADMAHLMTIKLCLGFVSGPMDQPGTTCFYFLPC